MLQYYEVNGYLVNCKLFESYEKVIKWLNNVMQLFLYGLNGKVLFCFIYNIDVQ